MPEITRSLLAVTVGRSRLGVAVFRNGTLAYYGGKSLRQYRSESDSHQAISKFLFKLIRRYGLNRLAMVDLNKQQRHSPAVISIDEHITTVARLNRLLIQKYNAVDVRKIICPNDKPTKENTARRLVERYPELARYEGGSNNWERRYYGFVFAAIGVGEVSALEFSENDKSLDYSIG